MGGEGKGHVVDRGDAAEAAGEPADLEHGLLGIAVAVTARRARSSCRRRGAVLGLAGRAGGGAFEEHRAQDVAALEQLLCRAREPHLALLHEIRAGGDRQGDVDRLLDEDDRAALLVDLAHDLEQLLDDRGRETERQLIDDQ